MNFAASLLILANLCVFGSAFMSTASPRAVRGLRMSDSSSFNPKNYPGKPRADCVATIY